VKRCSAMSRVCCSTPEALAANADADLVGGLADRIRRRERAIDEGSKAAECRGADQRAANGANAGAQQLRLRSEPLQLARGALACTLDALQASSRRSGRR